MIKDLQFKAKRRDNGEWVTGEKVGNFILTNMGAIVGLNDAHFLLCRSNFHEIDMDTLECVLPNALNTKEQFINELESLASGAEESYSDVLSTTLVSELSTLVTLENVFEAVAEGYKVFEGDRVLRLNEEEEWVRDVATNEEIEVRLEDVKTYTYKDLIIEASREYLSLDGEGLPPEYESWSDELFNEFLESNAWKPFEHHSACAIWQHIEERAQNLKCEYTERGDKVID